MNFLLVKTKDSNDDSFILTAYLTDKIKKGTLLWQSQ